MVEIRLVSLMGNNWAGRDRFGLLELSLNFPLLLLFYYNHQQLE